MQWEGRATWSMSRISIALAAAVLLGSTSQPVMAADQLLLLDVDVNGYSLRLIGDFVLRDGVLLSKRSELTALGIKVPGGPAASADELIDTATLPHVSWLLDLPHQSLRITATNDALVPAMIDGNPKAGAGMRLESSPGATLNYDMGSTTANGHTSVSGMLDARAFSRLGVFSTGALVYAGESASRLGTAPVVRLDSTWTYSDPDSLRRYRVGDFITGGLAWTRPTRLGGVQIASDFSMRPDLVTFPLPSLSGSAAVPSTMDVLVNGNRVLSREVGAGPFEIPQLPVVTGAGTVAVTLTNALGKQVVTTLPFYASSDLLAPGLQTWTAQAGALRRNWGVLSSDYGCMAASATMRRGVSQKLTLEATAEASTGTLMAGAGAVVNVADAAVMNVSVAASQGAGNSGGQLAAGLQRAGTKFSFGTFASVASTNFRDIAASGGNPVPRLQLNTSAGLSLDRFGSLGISFTWLRHDTALASLAAPVLPAALLAEPLAQRARLLSASYTVQMGKVSLFVTGFRDLDNSSNNGVMVGLTLPLGSRSAVGASAGTGQGGAYRQVHAQEAAVRVGDTGYQVYAATGAQAHQFAQAQYRAPWALLTAGVDQLDQHNASSLRMEGSLSLIDHTWFAANTINDSFAVVDTPGLAGVRVLYENREVGKTDASGRLLVPDLRAFDVNYLALDPTDIPPDAALNSVTREVRPQDRSGVIVRFPVKLSRSALLRVVDTTGMALQVGSTATLQSTGKAFPVGYEGAVYVDDLDPHNTLDVVGDRGEHCFVKFDYTPVPGNIPSIGPLTCENPTR